MLGLGQIIEYYDLWDIIRLLWFAHLLLLPLFEFGSKADVFSIPDSYAQAMKILQHPKQCYYLLLPHTPNICLLYPHIGSLSILFATIAHNLSIDP